MDISGVVTAINRIGSMYGNSLLLARAGTEPAIKGHHDEIRKTLAEISRALTV